jgi:hypothetical protein
MTTSRKSEVALVVVLLIFVGYQVAIGASERWAARSLQSELRAELKIGGTEKEIQIVFRENKLQAFYDERDRCYRSSEWHRHFLTWTHIRVVNVHIDAEKKVSEIEVKDLIVI